MIDTPVGGHTHGNDDPITVLHVLRRVAITLTLAILIICLCLLGVGLAMDDLRIYNLGLALLAGAPCGAVIATCAYFCELSLRSHRDTRGDVRRTSHHLDAIEAGERIIAEAMRSADDDDDDDDELGRRRES